MITLVAIVAALAGAVSSCGGSSHSATVSLPVLEGRATVTGAYSFSAPFSFGYSPNGPRATCTDAARNGTSAAGFVLGGSAKPDRAHVLQFGVRAERYRGPARYDARVTGLSVLDGPAFVTFDRGSATTTAITTDAHAGGTAALDGLVAEDGRTVSVHVEWTCAMRRVDQPA